MINWKDINIGDIIVFTGTYNDDILHEKDREQIVDDINKYHCRTRFIDNGYKNVFAINNPYAKNCSVINCVREYGNGLPIYWNEEVI